MPIAGNGKMIPALDDRDLYERFGLSGIVLCVVVDDETADGQHRSSLALLQLNKDYRVVEYQSPNECRRLFPQEPWWQKNGGRVVLEEHPGLAFFGRRFVGAKSRRREVGLVEG